MLAEPCPGAFEVMHLAGVAWTASWKRSCQANYPTPLVNRGVSRNGCSPPDAIYTMVYIGQNDPPANVAWVRVDWVKLTPVTPR